MKLEISRHTAVCHCGDVLDRCERHSNYADLEDKTTVEYICGEDVVLTTELGSEEANAETLGLITTVGVRASRTQGLVRTVSLGIGLETLKK